MWTTSPAARRWWRSCCKASKESCAVRDAAQLLLRAAETVGILTGNTGKLAGTAAAVDFL